VELRPICRLRNSRSLDIKFWLSTRVKLLVFRRAKHKGAAAKTAEISSADFSKNSVHHNEAFLQRGKNQKFIS